MGVLLLLGPISGYKAEFSGVAGTTGTMDSRKMGGDGDWARWPDVGILVSFLLLS